MKLKESSLDFHAFVAIYGDTILNSFIKKVYQVNQKEFVLQLYRSDIKKRDFFISLTKGIAFYDAEKPEEATQLSMLFRKQLSEKRIVGIEQINFDRVIKIVLHTGQEIILELFGSGNLILTDNGKIVFAMDQHVYKTRKVVIGEEYIPPVTVNPVGDLESFSEILDNSKASVVKTLATRANLGGEIAEEALYRSNIDKDKMPAEIKDKYELLYNNILEIINESSKNKAFYYESEELLSPVLLTATGKDPDKEFDDFNEGIDFYLKHYPETEKNKSSVERRIESQRKSIEEFNKYMLIYNEFGNYLKMNFQSLQKLLNIVYNNVKRSNTDNLTFNDLEISDIKPGKNEFSISYNGIEIALNYRESAGNNINHVFNTAKDYKGKIEGAEKAIEETKKLILKEKKIIKKKRVKYWFESYHWFTASAGNMVMAGRDAKTNEKLVKKHMSENDIYVHADLYGAPSTLIKNDGIDITEDTISEACEFSISLSRAWPAGLGSGTAYWVYPSQVSKTPESGEFVSKGSWIIRGKRNYVLNIPLELKISLIDYKDTQIPMISPAETKTDSKKWVIIKPGNEKRSTAADKIAKILEIERSEIESILPPGGSIIVENSKEIKELS
ncbi:ribosome rescue protein RqcH [Ferroplasma sp.]|uniref:ribosome rescue protein RqcH n=1 Tax=Ferroplasma sp. TaxID=2591003 RepID=UPI00307D9F84